MIYKRPHYKEVADRINESRSKIQVIVGPRQVGKSTLMGQVLEECTIPYDSYSADDVMGVTASWLAEIWEAQRMKMVARKEEKRLLVIDEVQKIRNWSETVKAEWDRDTREKRQLTVILLGYSRMLIKKGLTESLAGRFELIRLPHWSYTEMKECFGWTLPQYIYYGGYPGAAEYVNDERRWRNYVKDSLIEPSISKDVLMNTKVQKPQLLRQLFEIGCNYSGELLSLTKVASQLQDAGNVTTLAGYLQLLDESGLLCGLQKYASDTARKYNAIPKFQVHNNALRNVYADEDFTEAFESPKAWGRYVESAIGARLLHLDLPQEKEGNEFGVELPDEIDSQLMDQTLTEEMLANGNRLMDMNIPKGTLVMLVKRGNEFIIPNGQVELHVGDKLLFISEKKPE